MDDDAIIKKMCFYSVHGKVLGLGLGKKYHYFCGGIYIQIQIVFLNLKTIFLYKKELKSGFDKI